MRYIPSFACALALTSFACGGNPSGPSGSGTLYVRLTDSPFTDAKAVIVTFSEVSAHREDSAWAAVPFGGGATSWSCDLKRLQGPQDVLGGGTLTAGHYTQIRLMVSNATIYFDNPTTEAAACAATLAAPAGSRASVTIPSGEVKLNRGFDLAADGTTTIVLDLDGDKSIIHQAGTGTYIMNPVVSIKSLQ